MLDPNIPLAARAPQIPSAGQTLADWATRRQQQQAFDQQRQMGEQQIASNQALEQERRLKLKSAADSEQQQHAIDKIMQTAFDDDPDTGVSTFNRSLFEQGLVKGGMGHLYPQYAEQLDKLDADAQKMAGAKRSLLARTIYGIQQGGNTPEAVLTGAAFLKKNGAVTDDHLQQVLQALNQDPSPEGVNKLMTQLGSTLPEYRELLSVEEKRQLDAKKTKAEITKIEAEGENLKKYGRATPPEAQHVDFMLNGKPTKGAFVPDTQGGRYFHGGEDVTDRATPIPPASVQIQNRLGADMGNVSFDANRPDPATGNQLNPKTGLTPNSEYQGALMFALEGRMPPQGLGSNPRAQGARAAYQGKAAAMAAAAGVDLPQLQAEYRANSATLSKLLPQAKATATFANTATDNLDLALGQSDQVARSGSKFANKYLQWAQGNFTPATGLTKFETYIYTAAREYAKVTSGGALSAQALSDSAAKEASKLLNTAQAPQAFQAAVEAMKADMNNVIQNQAKTLGGVSSTIGNFFAAVNGVAGVNTPSAAPAASPGQAPVRRFNPATGKADPVR